jgi:hypothetical protein
MDSPHDASHLSITQDNRHQYYETAIADASEADREIRQAEARGQARREKEAEFKKTLQRVGLGAVAMVLVLVVFLLTRH